jgi:hypothetical protein
LGCYICRGFLDLIWQGECYWRPLGLHRMSHLASILGEVK